ncbi:uncharacterized protein JCM10292_005716 [Rhodotorula paludigena]|uniref:uncharacterized protein n=1 Tax=Rhodotorula paludigena TaxID=86838 RepID=UPI00318045B5
MLFRSRVPAILVRSTRCLARPAFSTLPAHLQPHPQANYQDTATNMSTVANHADLYSEIVVDHNNVKDLYHRYKTASSNDERATLVNTNVRELAVHSEAEEAGPYNTLEEKGLVQESTALRQEHQELEEILWSLDWTKIDNPDFGPKFEKAIEMFIKHSDREEEEVLKQLEGKLSPEENAKLAADFLAKRKVVPTRPHPAAPQSGGVVQKVLGMATKPHDKIIETLQGRHFADLKYQHSSGKVEPIKIDSALLLA